MDQRGVEGAQDLRRGEVRSRKGDGPARKNLKGKYPRTSPNFSGDIRGKNI